MARTRRRRPKNRESKNERLEREWERQAKHFRNQKIQPEREVGYPELQKLPARVESIRQEAEALVNARKGTLTVDKAAKTVPFSVQSPATDEPMELGGGLVWWTGRKMDDYIPVSE